MARICANCGYINDAADETTAICPNCGTPYTVSVSEPVTYAPPPPPPPIYQTGSRAGGGLSRNKRLLLIGLGGVAVLVMLIAGGVVALAASQGHATVAATATATATATPGKNQKVTLQSYSDPQGQFALKYPSTWQVNTGTATVGGANVNFTTFAAMNARGKATAGLVVAVGGSALSLQSAGAVVSQTGLTGFTPSNGPTMPITGRGGQTWQTITTSATAPDGKPANVFVAFTQHGSSSYLVAGFAGSKAGNTAGSRIFITILRSFSFGSGG